MGFIKVVDIDYCRKNDVVVKRSSGRPAELLFRTACFFKRWWQLMLPVPEGGISGGGCWRLDTKGRGSTRNAAAAAAAEGLVARFFIRL